MNSPVYIARYFPYCLLLPKPKPNMHFDNEILSISSFIPDNEAIYNEFHEFYVDNYCCCCCESNDYIGRDFVLFCIYKNIQ